MSEFIYDDEGNIIGEADETASAASTPVSTATAAPETIEAEKSAIDLIEEQLAKGPVSLATLMTIPRESIERPAPTIGSITGDDERGLFYPRKSNLVVAEPGVGKSLIMQAIHRDLGGEGTKSLYIDREKDWEDFLVRMIDLGTTIEAAKNIAYWKPRLPLALVADYLAQMVRRTGIAFITLDSLNRDVALAGLDENNNNDIRRWYSDSIEPLMAAGAGVAMVDHLKKAEEYRGTPIASKGRSAKGGIAKLEVVTGSVFVLETKAPFSKSQAGVARMRATKDNNGTWAVNEVAAEVHVKPGDDGSIGVDVRKPERSVNDAGQFRPTTLMERVSRYLEEHGPASMTDIRKNVSGSKDFLGPAAERLIEEGFADEDPGPRNARMVRSVKPFRDDSGEPSEPF